MFQPRNQHRSTTYPQCASVSSLVWRVKDICQLFIPQFMSCIFVMTLRFWKTWPIFQVKSPVCIISSGRKPSKWTKSLLLSTLNYGLVKPSLVTWERQDHYLGEFEMCFSLTCSLHLISKQALCFPVINDWLRKCGTSESCFLLYTLNITQRLTRRKASNSK